MRVGIIVVAMAIASIEAMGQAAGPAMPKYLPAAQRSMATTVGWSLPLQDQPKSLLFLAPQVLAPHEKLFGFKDSEIKFNLGELMGTLRDSRHEGWVLAAYPDPKTARPLIGAGFSLDVPATEHPQSDPLNPSQFLEPSSAQLWQAAGLDPQKLKAILDEYDQELEAWRTRGFRRMIRTHALTPEITDEEAEQLLRISAIEAIHNAEAYCRNFDKMTAYQQMALSQLVFQMGVNLQEFTHFLEAVNGGGAALSSGGGNREYWKTVQETLIYSDWARRYRERAVAVIAMFNPDYASGPWEAEREVRAALHPYYRHHQQRRHASVRTASARHHKTAGRKTHRS
jgi:GH24 family phage-related lysozyme (muramidase)